MFAWACLFGRHKMEGIGIDSIECCSVCGKYIVLDKGKAMAALHKDLERFRNVMKLAHSDASYYSLYAAMRGRISLLNLVEHL